MKLAKWDPFHEVDELLERYSRPVDWPFRGGRQLMNRNADWAPRVDISETDEKFIVKAEVPGIQREDIKINIEDHVLTIQGENKQEKEEKGEQFHRVERYYGSFSRSFSLPENVAEEKIEANFKDGLLTLKIPKTEASRPKAIEVKVS
ncbi:MAG: heat-shock protein [Desulfuromonas sp.]|nr:MAG: heat-shock protein [Desulfuromonas sp.]